MIVSGIVEGEMEEVRAGYEAVGLVPVQGMAADTVDRERLGRADG